MVDFWHDAQYIECVVICANGYITTASYCGDEWFYFDDSDSRNGEKPIYWIRFPKIN